MLTINKIQRAFSKSAKNYDRYSSLHREIADRLIGDVYRLMGRHHQSILDVGCGTGYLTVKLKDQCPNCEITGLDFSPAMLEVAKAKSKKTSWVLGDSGHLPFPDSSVDMVISNLAYQWEEDLSRAFSEVRRVLAPDGAFMCTLFGFNTCQELFQSLNEAKASLQFSRLPDEASVRQALFNSGFKDPEVHAESIKIEFKDMRELMGWVKSIGANGLSREGYLGSGAIARAVSIYHEKFPFRQGIGATFEVIRVYAKA